MLVKKLAKIFIVSFVLLGLVGCSSTKSPSTRKSQSNDMEVSQDDSADCKALVRGAGVDDAVEFYGEEVSPCEEKDLVQTKILYFDYDVYSLSEENRRIVLAHAKKLLDASNLSIRIEGHADERGSSEYNIALGEKRAKTIANLLMDKGVSGDRITVVSYGKEKPAVRGHDESAWKLNRRAELEYEKY